MVERYLGVNTNRCGDNAPKYANGEKGENNYFLKIKNREIFH